MESMSELKWRRQSGLKGIQTKLGKVAEVEMKAKEDEYEYEEEPLSPSARMFHQPNFNVHVIAVMGSTCTIQPQLIKQNLVHTLLKHPRFTSVLVYIRTIYILTLI